MTVKSYTNPEVTQHKQTDWYEQMPVNWKANLGLFVGPAYEACGYSLRDPEIQTGVLSADWKNHPKGSIVVRWRWQTHVIDFSE